MTLESVMSVCGQGDSRVLRADQWGGRSGNRARDGLYTFRLNP